MSSNLAISHINGIDYVTLEKETVLYHANDLEVQTPYPMICPDTGKFGVYFSAFDNYLEECRCTERMRDQTISIYYLIENVTVSVGKYGFTRGYSDPYPTTGWETVRNEDNISHYDDSLWPLDQNVIEYGNDHDSKHAELFLTPNDLKKVRFVSSYRLTLGSCIRKWYKQSWFESMAHEYIRMFRNPLNKHYTPRDDVDDGAMFVSKL